MTTGHELIGGSFELINSKGQLVRSEELKGKYLIIFFGFTHCSDICPMTLKTIMKVYKGLERKRDLVVPIFITIDPKNDTPIRLSKFKKNYDQSLLTLTGEKKDIDVVVKNYRSYYSKKSKTTIDHSPIIYLMDKNNKYISHFIASEGSKVILKKVKKLISSK